MKRVQVVLDNSRNKRDVASRMESLSREFIGCSYLGTLIGSATTPEVFTASLDQFDCVTYVETILALARARTAKEFESELKGIRYQRGRVEWKRRNHYMTGWIRNNVSAGRIGPVRLKGAVRTKDRILNVVPGLPARRQRFSCTPKQLLAASANDIHSGDLIFFASTRSHLDVFHCGIVVRAGQRLLMRHASRSQGGVVEQELSSFLDKNRMAGVIVTRPVDRGGE